MFVPSFTLTQVLSNYLPLRAITSSFFTPLGNQAWIGTFKVDKDCDFEYLHSNEFQPFILTIKQKDDDNVSNVLPFMHKW